MSITFPDGRVVYNENINGTFGGHIRFVRYSDSRIEVYLVDGDNDLEEYSNGYLLPDAIAKSFLSEIEKEDNE